MPFDLKTIVAAPGFAPEDWQTGAPREVYGHRAPVGPSLELDRVFALPRRALELDGSPRAEAIIDAMTERFSRGPRACKCATLDPERHAAEGCITRLRLVQALALREIGIAGGLLGPIGVGHGKTAMDLLAPLAFAHHAIATGVEGGATVLCVLLLPPKLIPQLIRDYDYIGEHFKMPSVIVQGSDVTRIQPGAPRLQVMAYTRLMQKGATSWMKNTAPHAIIADECHKLRNAKTATTARVLRYMEENPGTHFAAWSGSITSKSIKDYDHLAHWALKGGSPLPRNREVTEEWARCIDPGEKIPADPGTLLAAMIATGCCQPGESVRTGFRTRVSETVGVVTTSSPSVDCILEIAEEPGPVIPDRITELMDQALEFVRPDGEEFITAMEAVACAIQLASGFHYRWIYPTHVFPRDGALIDDWKGRRAEFHKAIRQKLKSRDEHLDSPALLVHAAERFYGLRPNHKDLPNWECPELIPWREIKPRVKYQTDAVLVDDFLVQHAAQWAHANRGIVWYQHSAFGQWLQRESGLPMFGAGDDSKIALAKERGDRSCIVSIKAHGTGTNGLQFHFADQLFANVPADPAAWEQTLGRLHRAGQRAPLVRARFYCHTPELRRHVSGALHAALYVQDTLPCGPQKLRSGITLEALRDFEDD